MEQSSENGFKPSRIVVWSDSHISKFTGVFHEEAFKLGVRNIVEILYKDPNTIVLHLGDVTDSGTFAALMSHLDKRLTNLEDK